MENSAPQWLERLLSTGNFFVDCGYHNGTRNECNLYCLDCNSGNPICFYCRSSHHNDHQVIQIRRSSYHDVVRVSEMEKFLDTGGVQTYVINNARVFFLNERPQHKPSYKASSSHLCEICRRSLLDPLRFCSLGCKLEGVKKNGNANFMLKNNEGVAVGRREGMTREEEEEAMTEYPSKLQYSNSRRRRKGVPHRAPLGT
ncbi:hypothetical protein UlMin_015378 [Ulmus minor]